MERIENLSFNKLNRYQLFIVIIILFLNYLYKFLNVFHNV